MVQTADYLNCLLFDFSVFALSFLYIWPHFQLATSSIPLPSNDQWAKRYVLSMCCLSTLWYYLQIKLTPIQWGLKRLPAHHPESIGAQGPKHTSVIWALLMVRKALPAWLQPRPSLRQTTLAIVANLNYFCVTSATLSTWRLEETSITSRTVLILLEWNPTVLTFQSPPWIKLNSRMGMISRASPLGFWTWRLLSRISPPRILLRHSCRVSLRVSHPILWHSSLHAVPNIMS